MGHRRQRSQLRRYCNRMRRRPSHARADRAGTSTPHQLPRSLNTAPHQLNTAVGGNSTFNWLWYPSARPIPRSRPTAPRRSRTSCRRSSIASLCSRPSGRPSSRCCERSSVIQVRPRRRRLSRWGAAAAELAPPTAPATAPASPPTRMTKLLRWRSVCAVCTSSWRASRPRTLRCAARTSSCSPHSRRRPISGKRAGSARSLGA